jgi:predicted nucleic acid-binding protein
MKGEIKLLYILDASVYVPLIATIGTCLLKITKGINFIILDLTIYETCNAFWKLWIKLHKISKKEAIKAC